MQFYLHPDFEYVVLVEVEIIKPEDPSYKIDAIKEECILEVSASIILMRSVINCDANQEMVFFS